MFPLFLSRRWIYGVLALLWMGVIFSFSSIHGSGTYFDPPFWYILERKGAHVFEFSLLAFLIASFFSSYLFFRKDTRLFFCFVFLFCVAYAFSDEIHQSFVFGREGRLTDVFIDTLGVLLGISFYFLWKEKKWNRRFMKKISRKKSKTSR